MGNYGTTTAGRKAAEKANSGTHYVKGGDSSAETVAAAQDKERLQSTAGTGLGAKGGGFVPPKLNAGEDAGTYRERVRKAREQYDAEPPKAKALRNMMK